jgi:hypothetical protein
MIAIKSTRIFLGGLLAALALCAVLAGPAFAGPTWKFNGEALEGEETIIGAAEKSGLTITGLTTTCDNFLYEITLDNEGGTGGGNVTDLPLFNCSTSSKYCTVEGIEAEEFPWGASLTQASGQNYIVIEGVHVTIVYGNPLCVLYETEVEVEGTAGGLLDNETESATFDNSSFEATGTELESFGNAVEWNGFFPAEPFEWHREETLTVS